jgi:hypothetical protein
VVGLKSDKRGSAIGTPSSNAAVVVVVVALLEMDTACALGIVGGSAGSAVRGDRLAVMDLFSRSMDRALEGLRRISIGWVTLTLTLTTNIIIIVEVHYYAADFYVVAAVLRVRTQFGAIAQLLIHFHVGFNRRRRRRRRSGHIGHGDGVFARLSQRGGGDVLLELLLLQLLFHLAAFKYVSRRMYMGKRPIKEEEMVVDMPIALGRDANESWNFEEGSSSELEEEGRRLFGRSRSCKAARGWNLTAPSSDRSSPPSFMDMLPPDVELNAISCESLNR